MWLSLFFAAHAAPPLTEILTTRDGVALEADLYLEPKSSTGVILLHMIPPHFERSSWPTDFITSLENEGWSVCVPDRRGAGASRGRAKHAYKGPGGRYDVEACVRRLMKAGTTEFAIIGASNGTTSMIDYAAWAPSESLPVPVFLGFMTGGSYTENNTPISAIQHIPAVLTYSVKERAWSAEQVKVPGWIHHEYEGGAHGTKMFSVRPQVRADLLTALKRGLTHPAKEDEQLKTSVDDSDSSDSGPPKAPQQPQQTTSPPAQ